jgi:hypothetical protein
MTTAAMTVSDYGYQADSANQVTPSAEQYAQMQRSAAANRALRAQDDSDWIPDNRPPKPVKATTYNWIKGGLYICAAIATIVLAVLVATKKL